MASRKLLRDEKTTGLAVAAAEFAHDIADE
jgi:hypothetical protein